eukprot:EG_transcript_16583
MSVIRTVAITNVDDSVVEERLRGFFSRCGPIRRMDFVATASPRKASIEFSTTAAFEEALRMNGVEVGGRQLQISRALTNLAPTVSPSGAGKAVVPTDGSFMERFLQGQLQPKKAAGKLKKDDGAPGIDVLQGLGLEEPPPPPPPPPPAPGAAGPPGANALERIAANLRQKLADKERLKELELQRERELGAEGGAAHRPSGWDHLGQVQDPALAAAATLSGRRSPGHLVQERERLGEKPPTLYISGLDTLLSDEDIMSFLTTQCGPLMHQKVIRDTLHTKHYGFFTFHAWDSFRKCLELDGHVGVGRFTLTVSVSMSAAARNPTVQPTSARPDREARHPPRSRRSPSRSRSRSRSRSPARARRSPGSAGRR